jgi:hypothetical protein
MSGLQYRGAFVVQFRYETNFAAGLVEGRVEHVATGRSGTVESATALLALLARLLDEVQSAQGES